MGPEFRASHLNADINYLIGESALPLRNNMIGQRDGHVCRRGSVILTCGASNARWADNKRDSDVAGAERSVSARPILNRGLGSPAPVRHRRRFSAPGRDSVEPTAVEL